MRILVNFQSRRGWTVHCLAEDCRTPISPFVDVESLPALRKLLRGAGANDEEMDDFEFCISAWNKGSIWINNLTEYGKKALNVRSAREG